MFEWYFLEDTLQCALVLMCVEFVLYMYIMLMFHLSLSIFTTPMLLFFTCLHVLDMVHGSNYFCALLKEYMQVVVLILSLLVVSVCTVAHGPRPDKQEIIELRTYILMIASQLVTRVCFLHPSHLLKYWEYTCLINI